VVVSVSGTGPEWGMGPLAPHWLRGWRGRAARGARGGARAGWSGAGAGSAWLCPKTRPSQHALCGMAASEIYLAGVGAGRRGTSSGLLTGALLGRKGRCVRRRGGNMLLSCGLVGHRWPKKCRTRNHAHPNRHTQPRPSQPPSKSALATEKMGS
jgi:hypothetical protein